MVDIKDVKRYRDTVLDEFEDRIKVSEDNANNSETQDDNRYWNGYADGVSDAIDVVNKFFDLFINDNEEDNNNNNLNK